MNDATPVLHPAMPSSIKKTSGDKTDARDVIAGLERPQICIELIEQHSWDKGTGKPATHNPHNEFLNMAAQIGIIGLLVMMAMFGMQWRSAGQLATPMEQSLARALVLTLGSGCLVNSLLLDHAEGLFYAWMSGLLYGGLKYALPDQPAWRK